MKFCVITHVEHVVKDDLYYAYGPYVNEMNIWFKYVDEVILVAPLLNKNSANPIYSPYSFKKLNFIKIPSIHLTSIKGIVQTFFSLPIIIVQIFKVFKNSDHIHLRCPGNIGLLGCFVQIFFPNKPKTAKYAGNWDPKSKQPWSYRLQKWILNNTLLTKNMQVLVYGEWPNTSKNIKPFFTATYSDIQKELLAPRDLNGLIKFIFVGTLSQGKQPLYAIQLVEKIKRLGVNAQLELYGEGKERLGIEKYIEDNELESIIFLKGNQSKETVERAYKESNFLILISKSEGWPKVVAEAMFWGCVPLTTNVSCVKYMIGERSRGVLLQQNLEKDANDIVELIVNTERYKKMCEEGQNWSQKYTLDYFESEIVKLIKK